MSEIDDIMTRSKEAKRCNVCELPPDWLQHSEVEENCLFPEDHHIYDDGYWETQEEKDIAYLIAEREIWMHTEEEHTKRLGDMVKERDWRLSKMREALNEQTSAIDRLNTRLDIINEKQNIIEKTQTLLLRQNEDECPSYHSFLDSGDGHNDGCALRNCGNEDCKTERCPEHPEHDWECGEHTWQQHHAHSDHFGDEKCECDYYSEVEPSMCECGSDMDAHSGGRCLLAHDTFMLAAEAETIAVAIRALPVVDACNCPHADTLLHRSDVLAIIEGR